MTNQPQPVFELSGRRVWVAGHRGLAGSAIARRLAADGCEILTVGREVVDLRRQDAVESWMAEERPDVVVVAAATVGGIVANDSRPGEFLYDNLAIASNVIEAARRLAVPKLLYLASNCIYPRLAPQPMREDSILTGPLEPTNQWYAIAKIAGMKLCESYHRQYGCNFITVVPASLYGPHDTFDIAGGHVLPALMVKCHEAKVAGRSKIEIWGSGRPLREFLFVDDMADAAAFLLQRYSDPTPINIGGGTEISIAELAQRIADVVGFQGRLALDSTKPDGMPRKLADSDRLDSLGWRPKTALDDGLAQTYRWFLDNVAQAQAETRVPCTEKTGR